jgi:diamine N-acetyltransferase
LTNSLKNSKNSKSTPGELYTTRFASPEDAETLVEVGKKTFRDTFAADNTVENMTSYLDKTFTIDQISKDLQDVNCIYILLHHGERVAGYAKLRKDVPGLSDLANIEIERLYACKEYLGKKAGKALMQTCVKVAVNLGCKAIRLGVWEHNTRAISFYERWGFKKIGAHPFLLGSDLQTDLVMEKIVDNHETTSL